MDNKQLQETLAKRMGRDNADISKLLEALVTTIKDRCGELDSIAIPGFGTFEAKKKLERIVVNPGTGKRMLVPPKITLSFKPSALLKSKIK
ncbi:MAG: HU family DNA-binding protein [Muribaculaceae bacterium]|jgi:nucleoid DNA-binding protein|nr:HU family DNA-binding protein [Muribaculaceae bacterium]MEE1337376.1 HU family DNA-binding protein [Muribaculaceae bacterium]